LNGPQQQVIDRENLDRQARYQQMIINTRLTALQAAQTLMGTTGFDDFDDKATGGVREISHPTLLAIAGDIEGYILGGIDPPPEAKAASKILTAVEGARGLRP
jgi:hypothetical protein